MNFSGETPDLYTVVPEKTTGVAGRSMMGSSHVYDIAAVSSLHFLASSCTAVVSYFLKSAPCLLYLFQPSFLYRS